MPRVKKQHLKRRPDGRYACRYKDQFFYGDTEDEALKAREEYKRAEKESAISVARGPFLCDFAISWLPLAKPSISFATYRIYSKLLEMLIDSCGEKRISEITPSDIKLVYTSQFIGMSDSYIRQARQIYTALFDAALSDGLISRNPCTEKSSRPHKGTKGAHRAITDMERYWIEHLCTNHRAWPAVMAMLYAGIRPPEAKALDIDRDVDFDAGIIRLTHFAHVSDNNHYEITQTGKTEKSSRVIPLLPPLEEALRGRHGPLVSSADGSPLTISGWDRLWESYISCMEKEINGINKRWYGRSREHKEILESGGQLPPWQSFGIVPYDLRHSFATMCRDRGVELNTVVQWMGHSDSSMVLQIYDEVSDRRSQTEAEKLKAAFTKKTAEISAASAVW